MAVQMTEPALVPTLTTAQQAFDRPDPTPIKYDPQDGHDAAQLHTISQVMNLLTAARNDRATRHERWARINRATFNQFWSTKRPDWMPSPQVVSIYPLLRSFIGIMLDNRVTATIAPYSLPTEPFASHLNKMADDLETVLESSYQVNHEEREWAMTIRDSLMYGAGIQKTAWETTLHGGIGDAATRRVNPWTFYPDPYATNTEDGNFYIEVRRMPVQEVDRRFPGFAEKAGASMILSVDDEPPRLFDWQSGSRKYLNPSSGISPATAPWGPDTTNSSARIGAMDLPAVVVVECWLREHTFTEVEDERTGAKVKFPKENWRVIVIADNQILMDERADNLWAHGQHPYSRVVWDDFGEFWGPSMVELLTSPQQMINRLLAALQQNIELTGNPVWKDGKRSSTSRVPLTNKPGTRVTVDESSRNVGWENPPMVRPEMFQLLSYYENAMRETVGMTQMQSSKTTPGGRPSTSVVESTQDSAYTVIRQAQRNLEYAMQEAVVRRADLVVENYTIPRLVAVAGGNAERTAIALKARHFQIPTDNGAIPMRYQLLIDAGSRSLTARSQIQQQWIMLFTLGAIDRRTLLRGLEIPNADALADAADAAEQKALAAGETMGPGARQRAGRTS